MSTGSGGRRALGTMEKVIMPTASCKSLLEGHQVCLIHFLNHVLTEQILSVKILSEQQTPKATFPSPI